MDEALRFVDVRDVALDFVADSGLSMLFLEVSLVTSSWSCFFGLDKGLKVSVDDEGCPCAIA